MSRYFLHFLITTCLLACLFPNAWAGARQARSLEDFGDISTVEAASAALERALAQIIKDGGGVLVIPPNAPEKLKIDNLKQARRSTYNEPPVVTIMDHRHGFTTYRVAPIGTHRDGTWTGFRVERVLNLGQQSLPHCGRHAAQAIENFVISGATSYMATLTHPVEKGQDARCYVDTIRGIWVGQFLNITSSVMGYAPPYDRAIVKSIGWDDARKRNYFTADLDHPHPAGGLVYNKHIVNGLQINGYSNCDNQTPGELSVNRHNYGVGDSFVFSGMFKYTGDVFSGFGDEGGIVLNAETVGVLDFFRSTVETVDWSQDEVTYAPGKVYAHTLSNSRPLINMNPEKWITAGVVRIVSPSGTYKGMSNPGHIGGPGRAFNYQGGLIIGSPECPWTDDIVGRFFAITDDTEVVLPNDTSTCGGYGKRPNRPVYRWYRIMELKSNDDGTKIIKILRIRWSAVAAGAPKLFRNDNYTSDGNDRPLPYMIAPGAWVYDISEGWAHTHNTGGYLGKDHPRKLRVVPHRDRGTKFDFEPGDPIEQPVGPDPWQPRPLRIRQFDQIPSTMPSASIEVQQLGRVQVPTCISIGGIIRRSEDLGKRKDGKPAFETVMNIDALANVGINFASEVLDAAIVFRQPDGKPQAIRWRQDAVGSSSLQVDPKTGTFLFHGGNMDIGGKAVTGAAGLSATATPARNLRGINVAVTAGTGTFNVHFPRPEADIAYAVSITPTWLTSLAVAEKRPDGFEIQFGTPPPDNAQLDWMIVR